MAGDRSRGPVVGPSPEGAQLLTQLQRPQPVLAPPQAGWRVEMQCRTAAQSASVSQQTERKIGFGVNPWSGDAGAGDRISSRQTGAAGVVGAAICEGTVGAVWGAAIAARGRSRTRKQRTRMRCM